MNRDEASYQLSHVSDKLFAAVATSSGEQKTTMSFQRRQQNVNNNSTVSRLFLINSYTFVLLHACCNTGVLVLELIGR